ncbi:unnamed protein product [Cyclocybe aegerita]|uniref:Uncharacterized protein n=1 Tax=Cyclocybe aegerita TaxID=1973307 RepID=A0A8S0WJM0_CYCAE|nr:unnamed protein product [Cyclocybe aegerita]
MMQQEVAAQEYQLVVVPVTHSSGLQSLTAEVLDYSPPEWSDDALCNLWPANWVARAVGETWRHLLIPTVPGQLFAICAGLVAMTISLALEGIIIGMPLDIFWAIVSVDYPGTNKNAAKAATIRNFHLPEELIEPLSSPAHPRNMKILAAFVSKKWAWAICDKFGLTRMHILTKSTPWRLQDIPVGKKVFISHLVYNRVFNVRCGTSYSV